MFRLPLIQYIAQGDYISAITHIVGALIVILLIQPMHEYAHGWVADRLGDPTARYSGRLSLNPMRHINWMGAALIMVAGIGYANPVPVNMRYFKNPKRDMALTALVGPVSNLVMALLSLLLSNGVYAIGNATGLTLLQNGMLYYDRSFGSMAICFIAMLFYMIAFFNVSIAVFNLIPIPPLDGSRLLTVFLPDRWYYTVIQYEQYIMIGFFVLVLSGLLSGPFSFVFGHVMGGLQWLAGVPFGF